MLGIIILNYRNWMVTKECVDSILKYEIDDDTRIIIIDNGSKNDSVYELERAYKDISNIEIVELNMNVGFAKANNIGIKICEQEGVRYAVLTNSDIIFKKNSINLLYDEIRKRDDAVIIGPGVKSAIGERLPSSLLYPIRLIDALEIGRLFRKERVNEDIVKNCTKVFSVSGCCFIIDIPKFKEINAFDENTFLYNEENILGIQVEQSKYNTYILPKAEIIHKHAASSGKQSDFVQIEYIKSNLYYWREYRKKNSITLLLILMCFYFKNCYLKCRNRQLHPTTILKEGLAIVFRFS